MTTDTRSSDVHETDPRRAEEHLTAALRLAHSPQARFALHLHRITRGPLSVEDVRCSEGIRMRIDDDPGYLAGLPVRGPIHADHHGRGLDLGPGQAVVVTPFAPAAVTTGDGTHVVVVRVEAAALEDALEALLGRTVQRPLRLPASTVPPTAGGAAWAGVVRSVGAPGPGPAALLANPLSAEPLQAALLAGLLRLTEHPEREALDAPVRTWGPRPVREGLDLVEAHPELPLTSGSVAARVGLSVLALQGCWRRHRDVLPRDDVDRVRMGRAHRDLESHRPDETTVSAVARSWGFSPRTFPAAYGARFGRSPAQTLRGPAFA
ncbi:AraC family transcriptional regulator [Actinomycetospora sp. TBRC 11914]|uniref:AraC-like ligand-binding domain-containing protein n=1 Tax=Actinomycetospora sp. TBRC 11914 TaxID=2729387 RepID=UPI00145D6365|nr:AraC family transcriptional regulator [Actinomycetospora sp. TBRC 11914]NMO88306.1 AraC family transcriptional regulator [Actinomycetospora sp. TBRC 11914]